MLNRKWRKLEIKHNITYNSEVFKSVCNDQMSLLQEIKLILKFKIYSGVEIMPRSWPKSNIFTLTIEYFGKRCLVISSLNAYFFNKKVVYKKVVLFWPNPLKYLRKLCYLFPKLKKVCWNFFKKVELD